MTESPSGQPLEQPPPRPIKTGNVLSGAVLGFLGSWLMIAVTLYALYSAYGDSSNAVQTVVTVLGLFALPVVAGVLLVSPRTRHWGAGLLMGVAIGSIAGAGICGGWVLAMS